MTYPPTHILNPEFKYVPAASTNVALTFARIIAARQVKEVNVTQLKRKVK